MQERAVVLQLLKAMCKRRPACWCGVEHSLWCRHWQDRLSGCGCLVMGKVCNPVTSDRTKICWQRADACQLHAIEVAA